MKLKNENTNPKKLSEKKMLKEGPGAGYTIETDGLSDIQVNSASVKQEEEWGVTLDIDATAVVDTMYAYSAYYGTGEMKNIPVRITSVYVDPYDAEYAVERFGSYDAIDERTLIDLASESLYSSDKTETRYGGGWSHSVYNGTVGDPDVWTGIIADDEIISFIDKAVTGDNYTEQYRVVIDDSDIYDYYETEEEAVDVADDLAVDPDYSDCDISVEFVREYWDYEGMPLDSTEYDIETVYTTHNSYEFVED